jgi:hypothetical protein
MALTDQPYLPLYVDDWMNNNKLKLCSPVAHGIMISVMCIMHKETEYGKILLKQKFKQTDKQIENFALQIAKQSSFDLPEILPGLTELINEKVLEIDGDFMVNQRMVRDAKISLERSISGFKGGKKTQKTNKKFAKAKPKANSVNVIVNEDVSENEDINNIKSEFLFFFILTAFCKTWDQFKQMRKGLKKPMTEHAEKLILKKLDGLSLGDPEEAVKILERSIENSWQTVYPLKNDNNGTNKQTSKGNAPAGNGTNPAVAF